MKNKNVRAFVLLCSAALFNFLVYIGSKYITADSYHYNFQLPFEDAIPLLPWTILIYWGAYLFWIVNYCISTLYDKKDGDRFILSHFLGEIVCFLFFVLLPTTIVRPEIKGSSVFDHMLRITYEVDSPDNLLPSIHCYVSWLCFIGVRKKAYIPRWYQIASLVIAAAICISTLTVKQHVAIDVAAGILLAEGAGLASRGVIGNGSH